MAIQATIRSDWGQLPVELLELILQRLQNDYRPFNCACKSWSSIKESTDRHPLKFPVKGSQWLFRYSTDSQAFEFFHPLYKGKKYSHQQNFTMPNPVTKYSREGLVLMSMGEQNLFLMNMFDGQMTNLPDLPDLGGYECQNIIFTNSLASKDCWVIGIIDHPKNEVSHGGVEIISLNRGKTWWNQMFRSYRTQFTLAKCAPVFYKNRCYCLGQDEKLGVFNPSSNNWTILKKPAPMLKIYKFEVYLSLFGEELIKVDMGEEVSIKKLIEPDKTWVKLYTLGQHACFLGKETSFTTTSVINVMRNKNFLPINYVDSSIFYSPETGEFHTFHSGLKVNTISGAEIQHSKGMWIEPRLSEEEERKQWCSTEDDETKEEVNEMLQKWKDMVSRKKMKGHGL